MQVEKAIVAEEMLAVNPELHQAIITLLGGVSLEAISHDEFKMRTKSAAAVVRTGEFTPYANIILVAGVVF